MSSTRIWLISITNRRRCVAASQSNHLLSKPTPESTEALIINWNDDNVESNLAICSRNIIYWYCTRKMSAYLHYQDNVSDWIEDKFFEFQLRSTSCRLGSIIYVARARKAPPKFTFPTYQWTNLMLVCTCRIASLNPKRFVANSHL